jgi:site-specific recombinase XerD
VAAFEIERLGKVRNFAFTVYDVLGLVLRDYQVTKKRSERTLKYRLANLDDFFGREKLARDVTAEDVENYVLLRRTQQRPGSKEPTAEATIRVELAALKRGFNLAARLRRGLTLDNIPPFPVIPNESLNVRHGFLRTGEVHRVMSFLDGDLADLVEFLFATAWRFSEAAERLKWQNVEDDRLWIATSKSGHPRTIPIAGDLIPIMQRRLRRKNGDYVFHHEGKKIVSFQWHWKRANARAGYEDKHWVVHDLRRSAIVRMIEAGIDQKTVMQWSGHRTDSVFRRYMIVTMDRMVQAAERVSDLERQRATHPRHLDGRGEREYRWQRH